jgi:alanine dehydrogenase
MPAACARTASLALERSVLPFIRRIVEGEEDEALETGRQVHAGRIVHEQLARDTRRAFAPA